MPDSPRVGHPIWCTTAEEGPAYGAALLGSVVGRGFSSIQDAVVSGVQLLGPIEPTSAAADVYDGYFDVYRRLYSDIRESSHLLTSLAGGN